MDSKKITTSYYKTFRDAPADAETISNQLMMRAGFLKKHAPGIFSYTPLMTRSILKVSNHIREVFNDIGWQECLMPMVIPADLWKETGRWDLFGDQLLRFKDRKNLEYCLGPTHEEVVTDLARYYLNSYRQLPFALYQIQTKFRDEIRPRFGVMRAREFIMLDGYSFHLDAADLDRHYEEVRKAYCRFFDRLELKYRVVEADTGAIGGHDSHEFHVLADSGEDLILWCDHCAYAANVERAERPKEYSLQGTSANTPAPMLKEIPTPGAVSIEDVCKQLKILAKNTLKAVVFRNPFTDELAGVAVRGDLEVSMTKIATRLGWAGVEQAPENTIRNKFNVEPGSYSPVVMKEMKWLVDISVEPNIPLVGGSGKKDTHFINTVLGRDFSSEHILDIAVAREGDQCPRCQKGKYSASRGIEVGHIFKLGLKYSKAMNLNYSDLSGNTALPIMGTYGIGVTRVIAACIEQNHDKDGIKFPKSIAPIDLQVVTLASDPQIEKLTALALNIGRQTKSNVLVDDRDAHAGVKLKDADLTGAPFQLVLGKRVAEGFAEFKTRMTGQKEMVPLAEVENKIRAALQGS